VNVTADSGNVTDILMTSFEAAPSKVTTTVAAMKRPVCEGGKSMSQYPLPGIQQGAAVVTARKDARTT
jgi:hypothetical protein